MGFYPFTQATAGFIVSPAEPYARLLRSLFPGVPKDWLHALSHSDDRLVVFARSLSYGHGGFDSTLSVEDCRRGYVQWNMSTSPTTTGANDDWRQRRPRD